MTVFMVGLTMFFRLSFKLVVSGLLAISLLTGCDQIFNKTPAILESPNPYIGFQTQCLADVLPTMQRFMTGSASTTEVNATWDCFGSAISVFEKKVRGANRDQFTGRELATFFETYFFKDLKLSDKLLLQVMNLKQLFVGGTNDRITRAELLRLIHFAEKMKSVSMKILPYMKVYTRNWQLNSSGNLQENLQYFEDSNLAIQDAVKSLAELISGDDQTYAIANLAGLLHEIEALYNVHWPWLDTLDHGLPLVSKLKGALAGGNPALIKANEWRRLSILLSRGYIQYLRYFYYIQKSDDAEPQWAYFSDSVTDLFSYLEDMVREKPGSVFSKQELQDILVAFTGVFPEVHFNSDFVEQVMKIKVLIFAGSAERWTPEDFDRGKTKVVVFRTIMENVISIVKVLSLNWQPSTMSEAEAQKYFRGASDTLYQSTLLLGSILETDYDLKDFSRLLEDIEALLSGPDSKLGILGQIRKFVPTLTSAKQIVLNDQTSVIQKAKWPDVFGFTAHFVEQGLYYYYFVNPRSADSGPGLESADLLIKNLMGVLTQLINFRVTQNPVRGVPSSGEISNLELTNLILSLKSAGILPGDLTPESMNMAVTAVTQKIIYDPKLRLSGHKPTGFSKDNITYLQNELGIWSSTQHLLSKVFTDAGKKELSGVQLLKILESVPLVGAAELQRIVSISPSFVLDPQGRLYLGKNNRNYDLHSAGNLNFARLLARLVIHGYAGDLDRAIDPARGVTLDEMNALYTDVKSVIVAMGLVEPNNIVFAKNRFMEANLFTPAADGNDYLNLAEGSQLFTMIMSGLTLNGMVVKALGDQCVAKVGASDIETRLKVDCVIDFYRKNFTTIFSSMPDLSVYMTKATPEVFHYITFDFLKSTGWVPTADNTATRSDLNLLPHVFQYAESTFQRFDTDKDGFLTDEEVKMAYPIYRGLLSKFSGTNIDVINRAAFYYIAIKGTIPCGFTDLISYIWKIWWNKKINAHVDRGNLSDLFGSIADVLSGGGKKCSNKSARPFDPPPGFINQTEGAPSLDFSILPVVQTPMGSSFFSDSEE